MTKIDGEGKKETNGERICEIKDDCLGNANVCQIMSNVIAGRYSVRLAYYADDNIH